MHTGIKQVEVDKIEKIAGSKKKKKHILSGHTRTNNTCGKKKKRRIKRTLLWNHVSTLQKMPTDEFNGKNY